MVIDGDVRNLTGDSCAELARAAALIVRIGLRAFDELDALAAPAAILPPPVTLPVPPTAAELSVDRTLARAEPARPAWSVGTGLGIDVGALPGAAPMVQLQVAVRGAHLAGGIDAALATGQRELDDAAATVAHMRRYTAGTHVCSGGAWAWLCAGVDAGMLQVTAESLRFRTSGNGAWIAARAGPAAILRLPRDCELVVQADAAVPLVYPRFTMRGTVVHDPGGVALQSSLTLQRRFR
jgi:hypothetical protein